MRRRHRSCQPDRADWRYRPRALGSADGRAGPPAPQRRRPCARAGPAAVDAGPASADGRRRADAARQRDDVAGAAAARRGCLRAQHGRGRGHRGDLRGAPRAGDPLRHGHVAGGPRQRARGRGLHRPVGDGRDPCRQPGRPGLHGPAGRHPQGAERASARRGPVLPHRPRRRRVAGRDGVHPCVGDERGALRHDARRRAGAGGGDAGRAGDPHRRARPQDVRGLRPDAADGRRGGDAGGHHRADAAPARHPRADRVGGLLLRVGPRRLRDGDGRDPDGPAGRADGASGRAAGAGVERVFPDGPAGGAAAPSGVPRQPGGRGRAGRDDAGRRGRPWRHGLPMDRVDGGAHRALAGPPRRLLGGLRAAAGGRRGCRPTSACRCRGWRRAWRRRRRGRPRWA